MIISVFIFSTRQGKAWIGIYPFRRTYTTKNDLKGQNNSSQVIIIGGTLLEKQSNEAKRTFKNFK